MTSVKYDASLPRSVALAFAPLHKRAFGTALAVASALLMAFVTIMPLLRPEPQIDITLLNEYFVGYTMTWEGAGIAIVYGALVGFVMGWFIAFCRNLVIAVSVFAIRTRAEMMQTRDFLDHI